MPSTQVSFGSQPGRCSECGRSFDGSYRSNKMTCGTTCRTARKRRLQKANAEAKAQEQEMQAQLLPKASQTRQEGHGRVNPHISGVVVGSVLSGPSETVKGAAGVVPAAAERTLDGGAVQVSCTSVVRHQADDLPSGERRVVEPGLSGVVVGSWEWALGRWIRRAVIGTTQIVAEMHASTEGPGGYIGWLMWTTLDGVPLRYSPYVRECPLVECREELDYRLEERLALLPSLPCWDHYNEREPRFTVFRPVL